VVRPLVLLVQGNRRCWRGNLNEEVNSYQKSDAQGKNKRRYNKLGIRGDPSKVQWGRGQKVRKRITNKSN